MIFPSPVALSIGCIPIYWYGISYAFSGFLAWRWSSFLIEKKKFTLPPDALSDFLTWAMIGIVIGGRLGHVFLYEWDTYRHHPAEIFKTWKGGMAFHGAALGLFCAALLYCWHRKISWKKFADCGLCGVPIGLFLGRLANFINQEIYGTPVSWGIVFPRVDDLPRHPCQLYEAFGEGIFLFLFLNGAVFYSQTAKKPGRVSGLFLIGYSLIRWACEYVKDLPDTILSYQPYLTLGQCYNVPMLALGIYLLWDSARDKTPIRH